ncbi:LytR/AlgR family response regulator transcription factor [Taibaiella chishuiensis]|uniref:LytTR family two component transcriptional regulator n=1 Tax=Taibaiella chishuiensis TaxID=1434707 RepID=A0A2P8D2T5_9BACT|nr:LytTR family DNA-binding domain-containing protein [Taibaiella chishuiensis]PSK91537.1 LytTR family two component transcriptional regulator [Taibaiella chishuiensis]
MILSILIVDDEEGSRKTLRHFLERYCTDVQVVAEADSVATAVLEIEQHKPMLVFLDINMPQENGFALFNKIPKPSFQTIFVTAYDSYALQAIRQQAIDYILKPLNVKSLTEAVERARQYCTQQQLAERVGDLLVSLQPGPAPKIKIDLPTTNGFIYVSVAEIIRCEALDNYTSFHFTDRKPVVVCRTLGHYETVLKDFGFIRVHHQHLINPDHLLQYQHGRGGTLLMSDQAEVSVSQRKREEFLKSIRIKTAQKK